MMTRANILVTGGAGFVGSHTCKALADAGYLPVAYDDLSNGVGDAVRWGPLETGSLDDAPRLRQLFARYNPVAVIHFAGFIEAGASVRQPLRFYRNNVAGSLTLLQAMGDAGVRHLVFSSTAAVYGEPEMVPIPETHPLRPINPYGRSKLMIEDVLRDMADAGDLSFAALRYFNAAGADPDGVLRENHQPETHLIPLVLQAAFGQRPDIAVYGTDYDTPDGTCIRDYVHVSDLARAHVLAVRRLIGGGGNLVANLGTGRGFSVREVIRTVAEVTGRPVPTRFAERRPGDPAVLVADARIARSELGWVPAHPDLADQVRHAARSLYPADFAGPLTP